MAFIRLSLILLFSLGNLFLFAQSDLFSNKYIEPSWYYGSVLPQNSSIRYLVNHHLQAYQLNVGINTDGSREWHQYLNYPRLGFGYHRSSLGNDDVFGHVNAFYGTVAIKTFDQKQCVNLEHNLTTGIGLLTKQYYLHKNPLNIAFGGPLVFFLQYALLLPVRLNKSVEVFAGPCFSHVSVAKIIQPNLGLHMVQIRAGGRYNISPPDFRSRMERQPVSDLSRHRITLFAAGGIKQYSRFDPDKYAIFALLPEYSYMISHVFGVGGGLGFYLDNSVKPYIMEQFGEKARFDQVFHSTIQAAFYLYIGDLTFLIQPGTYLYQNFENYHQKIIYKFGFRYRISDRICASALLKAQWLAKADFLEIGAGYSFLKNKK